MDPQFGDDLLAGFSSDSEPEMADSQDESDGGASGLDLLASMLDVQEAHGDEQREREVVREPEKTVKAAVSRVKRPLAGEASGGHKTKRRKRTSESLEAQGERMEDKELSQMKAKMKQMEEELNKLRQQVDTSEQLKGHSPQSRPQPPSTAAHARTVPSAGGGKRTRVAHQPNPKVMDTITRLSESAHKKQRQLTQGTSTSGSVTGPTNTNVSSDRQVAAGIIGQRQKDEENGCATEKYSGLRIKNPLISSQLMKQRMEGRKMVRVHQVASRSRGGDVEGDWVTIGVVVDKLPPRDTAKGNKFTVWKLSDLSSQNAVISLFLFGKAYQEHWKTAQGTVVALLNPSIMPDKETQSGATNSQASKSLALSIDHPQKLMLMGVSLDFTICKAHTKSGKKCTNFANSSDGGYCDYHTQGAYNRTSSRRMDCQGGYGPSAAKMRGKIFQQSKTEVYYYGGQSFSSGVATSSKGSSSGKGSSLSSEMDRRLFAPGAKVRAAEISKELKERREATSVGSVQSGRGVVMQGGSELFKQMLKTQSAGARMLSQHLHKEETVRKSADKLPEMSASELLKLHNKSDVTVKLSARPLQKAPRRAGDAGAKCAEVEVEFDELFAPDCVVSRDGMVEAIGHRSVDKRSLSQRQKSAAGNQAEQTAEMNKGDKDGGLSLESTDGRLESKELEESSCCSKPSVCVQSRRSHDRDRETGEGDSAPLKEQPPGSPQVHSADQQLCGVPTSSKSVLASRTRKPCLRIMEQQGGAKFGGGGRGGGLCGTRTGVSTPLSPPQLGKGLRPDGLVDLHCTGAGHKPSLAKLKALAIVRQKGALEKKQETSGGNRTPLTPSQQEAVKKRVEESSGSQSDDSDEEEGTKSLHLDPTYIEQIMNAKSSHDWAVKEEEWEKELEYFEQLEKKENMEEKLKSIKELSVSVIQCKQCNYVAEYPGELCKKENHRLYRLKAVKRWFECQDCRERCCTYNQRYPAIACRKCNGKRFKQTSLFKERGGPKLLSEKLLVRGVEEKYLNSLK